MIRFAFGLVLLVFYALALCGLGLLMAVLRVFDKSGKDER